jgi:opine dehydrogenase
LTLSVDNQIIHPARCYGLWLGSKNGQWPDAESVPFFYRDFDEKSAGILANLDRDYSAVRAAIRERFPDVDFKYMLSYLELENLNHRSGNTDILSSLRNNRQLARIQTPTVPGSDGASRTLDTNFRFFTDDIAYGVLIVKWMAEKLLVSTPCIDEVIGWAQRIRGEEFLRPDGYINTPWCLSDKFRTGIPPAYGLTSIVDVLDSP